MKRTLPLIITAVSGFVLIAAVFIPVAEKWGEHAAVWFDILAAIAFVLGGGNLMKVHLKKISDRAAGWGFSAVTLIAFMATLYFGLFKTGTHPAPKQEFYGEVFAPLQLDDLPQSQIAKIKGEIPTKGDGKGVPPSARQQLSQRDGFLVFHGWMRGNQKKDLIEYQDKLEWQATIEDLFDQSQAKPPLKGKVNYYFDHRALAFKGYMTEKEKGALLALGKDTNKAWIAAVESLYAQSHKTHSIEVKELPPGGKIPKDLDNVSFSSSEKKLSVNGPMSTDQRDALAAQFRIARPLFGDKRKAFLAELESKGDKLTEGQLKVFNKALDGSWTFKLLKTTLNNAGEPQEKEKTAKEMLKEMKAGVRVIDPKKKVGRKVKLTPAHEKLIEQYTNDESMTREDLVKALDKENERVVLAAMKQPTFPAQIKAFSEMNLFEERQKDALAKFEESNPTVGTRNQRLFVALLAAGPVSDGQKEFLVSDYQREYAWTKTINTLFVEAHTVKYPWSGEYREQGAPFWWMYEYAFKPLTATMFAMLAFYVASAAFRAFRAKNLEANLLLGTAFIILLGRTAAGVVLTEWMPESLSGLRIERLTVYIMQIFNTAGNRAIMIGIALGIASTSLKVLLGVDRSYLGSGED